LCWVFLWAKFDACVIENERLSRGKTVRLNHLASLLLLALAGCQSAVPQLTATVDRNVVSRPFPEDTSFHANQMIAFPGADGAGRLAQGGRGGRVYTVTTLQDGGPGSLREAVEAAGPRTVVFAVSGTIALQSELIVRNGRITIAGQTAPGDGITLRDQPFTIAASDVVVRFIRSRLGDVTQVDGDAIGVISGRRIILDHVSASWSSDESLSVAANFKTPERSYDEVTVQWSLIGESLNHTAAKGPGVTHGFGSLVRAAKGARVTYHHNLWLHHQDRMPRPGNYNKPDVDPVGGFFDFRSNVFYNWGAERSGYNMDFEGTHSNYNFVDNCYWTGPSSKGAWAFEESSSRARAYFNGNTMNGVMPRDPWSLVRAHAKHLPMGLPPGYKSGQAFPVAPLEADPAATACPRVIDIAGASLVRDAVDQRLINDFKQRKGRIINSQQEVGGWPELRSLPAGVDTDGDGMPDEWELAQGLNPRDAEDGNRMDPKTGYTQLELYLADVVRRKRQP
jgi:pectate lyase